MALIKCPQCGGILSDKALICPHCSLDIQNYYKEQKEEQEKLKKIFEKQMEENRRQREAREKDEEEKRLKEKKKKQRKDQVTEKLKKLKQNIFFYCNQFLITIKKRKRLFLSLCTLAVIVCVAGGSYKLYSSHILEGVYSYDVNHISVANDIQESDGHKITASCNQIMENIQLVNGWKTISLHKDGSLTLKIDNDNSAPTLFFWEDHKKSNLINNYEMIPETIQLQFQFKNKGYTYIKETTFIQHTCKLVVAAIDDNYNTRIYDPNEKHSAYMDNLEQVLDDLTSRLSDSSYESSDIVLDEFEDFTLGMQQKDSETYNFYIYGAAIDDIATPSE